MIEETFPPLQHIDSQALLYLDYLLLFFTESNGFLSPVGRGGAMPRFRELGVGRYHFVGGPQRRQLPRGFPWQSWGAKDSQHLALPMELDKDARQ